MTNAKVFVFAAALAFCVNLLSLFWSYKNLTEYPYKKIEAKLLSQKQKVSQNGNKYFLLTFKADDFIFQSTSVNAFFGYEDYYFDVTAKTSDISFLDFLKAPRLQNTDIVNTQKIDSSKLDIKNFISSQHSSEQVKELYLNLFLNTEVSNEVDDFIKVFGLGAFFALSGLNVALIVGFIFLAFSPLFVFFQSRFFPYINRKAWLMSASLLFLLFYAYLTDFTPSFIRAVTAAMIVFYMSLKGEEVLSSKTLAATILISISLFPTFLFSIGFWLSVCGVFFIYLFAKNTTIKNDFANYILLSIWLFLVMQPILHYLFGLFTNAHALNPVFSILFDVFYPLSFVLHILKLGWLFDDALFGLIQLTNIFTKYEFQTPLWFLMIYFALSVFAAKNKRYGFLGLNIAAGSYFVSAAIFLFYGI